MRNPFISVNVGGLPQITAHNSFHGFTIRSPLVGMHQHPPVCFLFMRVDESTDWQADDTVDKSSKPWPGLAVQLFTLSATEREKKHRKNTCHLLKSLKNNFSLIHCPLYNTVVCLPFHIHMQSHTKIPFAIGPPAPPPDLSSYHHWSQQICFTGSQKVGSKERHRGAECHLIKAFLNRSVCYYHPPLLVQALPNALI